MELSAPQEDYYAAKCVFACDLVDNGERKPAFEERIVLLQATSFAEAFEMAAIEGRRYAGEDQSSHRTRFIACVGVFLVQDPLETGVQVFSMIRESPLPPDAYLRQFHRTGTELDSFLFQTAPDPIPADSQPTAAP